MASVIPTTGPRWAKFLPVVERELRIAARGKATYRWRASLVAVGLALIGVMTWAFSTQGMPQANQGQTLFYTLIWVSSTYAFLAGTSVTADSVSREKREGTLGLLFLTDLRGRDIILGKLAANSLNTVYGLIGLIPLLAIPILMGGVSVESGMIATLGVLNLMFFSVSLGIFVSTISWDERRGLFAAIVAGLAVLVGPFLMGGLWVAMFGRGPLWSVILSGLSPIFPLMSMVPNLTGTRAWPPFLDLLPSHLLAWGLLVLAGRLVETAWYSRSGAPVKRTVDERVFAAKNPESRAKHRRRMLEAHPLVWLLERHPGKRFYADGLVLAILAIWYWGYRAYGTDMFGGPSWFLVVPLAFLLHLIFASWVVAESSMRLLEDRRSGALELLMCTSLSDGDLIRGHRLALRRLFLRPLILLAAAEVFIAFTGFGAGDSADDSARNGRWMMLALAYAVFLDTHTLSWISLRLAIWLATVNRVGTYALSITPLGPILLTACIAPMGIARFGTPGESNFWIVVLTWVSCVTLVDVLVGQWYCRRSVNRAFRELAVRTQPRAATAG